MYTCILCAFIGIAIMVIGFCFFSSPWNRVLPFYKNNKIKKYNGKSRAVVSVQLYTYKRQRSMYLIHIKYAHNNDCCRRTIRVSRKLHTCIQLIYYYIISCAIAFVGFIKIYKLHKLYSMLLIVERPGGMAQWMRSLWNSILSIVE